ncbi:MAG: hypothetical protein NWT08_06450 [Akkermansiaceae bacterium]|nr:hypothetical protein [Akkermansiaceae bacterium]MDP4645609.1 hypothetical protein [Akkermansiaceae bacterium]MDP4719972.1 hypothetical protein [Akkermansiaceae bacterium]MDP4780833.1 hypothetical protein [Akkermansiaceae bacterium]MDP4848407.1 hypothetical protein [Akkermansiaceae bacterium]
MKKGKVAEPEKELRFTRAGQAVQFCIAGAVLVGVGVTLVATSFYRDVNPAVPSGWWSVPCFVAAAGAFRLALRLAKHAYLILTPMGVEVFPFFKAAEKMQVVMWSEIKGADVTGKWLTLHFNEEKTAGMHLTLAPVRASLRGLLVRGVLGRLEKL